MSSGVILPRIPNCRTAGLGPPLGQYFGSKDLDRVFSFILVFLASMNRSIIVEKLANKTSKGSFNAGRTNLGLVEEESSIGSEKPFSRDLIGLKPQRACLQ